MCEISDINPGVIHVTVGTKRRIRRQDGEGYTIHYEDLAPPQVGWWEEVATTVTLVTAIVPCIEYGTPTSLIRQAIERGLAQGRVSRSDAQHLASRAPRRPPE